MQDKRVIKMFGYAILGALFVCSKEFSWVRARFTKSSLATK